MHVSIVNIGKPMNNWAPELEAIDRSLTEVAERVTQDEPVKGGSSAEAILDTLKLMRNVLGEVTERMTWLEYTESMG